jgi:hypothetical protein
MKGIVSWQKFGEMCHAMTVFARPFCAAKAWVFQAVAI